jgi:hypothetical protein
MTMVFDLSLSGNGRFYITASQHQALASATFTGSSLVLASFVRLLKMSRDKQDDKDTLLLANLI